MSLFDLAKKFKAVYLEGYISFDEEMKHAVQILDEDNKEILMEVFVSKEKAFEYIREYNSK